MRIATLVPVLLLLPRLRRALLMLALAGAGTAAAPAGLRAQAHDHSHDHQAASHPRAHHPAPRPGVTAERVLPAERFQRERHREAYRMARAIPHVLDGLFCHCNCHDTRGLRSLLDCFHSEMAAGCGICQGQARLAFRLHQQGKSLDEIRDAVDREYSG